MWMEAKNHFPLTGILQTMGIIFFKMSNWLYKNAVFYLPSTYLPSVIGMV